MAGTRGAETPHYHGHRKRLKARFRQVGPDAFPDYELMELLLFSVIPRRDTKPLAKQLIVTFDGFSSAIRADRESLAAIPGVGPAVIERFELVRLAVARLTDTSDVVRRPLANSWGRLLNHCRASADQSCLSQLRILFLDNRHRLMREERLDLADTGVACLCPAEVLKRTLANGAAGVVLVQHRSSADPKASDADVSFTREVAQVCQMVDIALHDHVLIGSDDHYSFRREGWV